MFRKYLVQSKLHLLLASAILISAFSTSTVLAASPWDNAIKTTSSLTIGDGSSDYSHTYIEYMRDNCGFYYNLFLNTLSDPHGKWAIVQQHVTSTVNVVTIEWTANLSASTTFLSDNPSPGNYSVGLTNTNYHVDLWNTPGFSKCYTGMGESSLLGTTQSGFGWDLKVFLSTYPVTYPSGYDGETIPDVLADDDGDGLDALEEQIQGTSDGSKDTDGDGLSDFTESIWNTARDNEFCNTTTTPHTCSYPHPTQQDVYTQIDWMSGDKPSDTQLGMVSDAFAAKGIFFHADTGQYGGGNEISSEAELPFFKDPLQTDFFDIKAANFSADRQGIWRYMISGYNGFNIKDPDHGYDTTSSGLTAAGSDNSFVSYGYVYNNQLSFYITDFDTAIAGTMLHEIGHSLCLSSAQRYSYQDPECEYAGIDTGDPNPLGTNIYPSYNSVMNYSNQMAQVDYSDGSHASSSNDHDDWTATGNHMSDFTRWTYSEIDSGARPAGNSRLSVAITPSTAKKLHDRGLLRRGKTVWRHLKVEKNRT